MNQSPDIDQKPIFGPTLGLNGPNLGQNFFARRNILHQQLDIIASNQNVQYQKNRMSQSRDIGRKLYFGPNLGLNGPNLGRENFFMHQDHQYLLDIIIVYQNMQNQQNLMKRTRENGQKPHFGPKFGTFCPNLGREFFFSENRASSL